MLRRLVVLGLSSVSFTSSLAAQQSPASCNPASGPAAPFSVAASGGISKGAYQAGALWSILQAERVARTPSVSGNREGRVPHLVSLAGASAGNVNTLLMALEWATDVSAGAGSTPRNERSSLLWTTWTNVGMDSLVPAEPKGDAVRSALAPGAFDGAKERLLSAATDATLLPCTIPIGITLTRASTHGRYVVRDFREVVVQRYASVAHFATDGRGYRLRAPRRSDFGIGIGAAILAEPDTANPELLSLPHFLDHVQASAAFPVAFPPVPLHFRYIEGRPQSARCRQDGARGCGPNDHDNFLDGGVFDNNPLGLAIELPPHAARDRRTTGLRVWFVSPGQRRPAASDSTPPADTTPFGVLRYARYGGSLVGVAADYELFALERRLQAQEYSCRNGRPERDVCFLPSTRFFPIYGATANSFGAFLGKPLREIDFYVGVYDGVTAAVRHTRCVDLRENEVRTPDCLRDGVRAMLDSAQHFLPELSPEGRTILDALWRREYRGVREEYPEDAPARVKRLLALLDHLIVEEQRPRNEQERAESRCKAMPVELSLFCADGLRAALRAHAQSPFRIATTALDGEPDEQRFSALLDDFDSSIYRIVRPVLFRQWQVETGTAKGRAFTRAGAKAAQYFIAADEESYRRGFELDPSTVPDHEAEGDRFWPHLFPFAIDGWRGMARASWSPSLVYRGLELGAGPSVMRTTPVFKTGDGRAFQLQGGLRLRTPSVDIPKIPDPALDLQWDCSSLDCGAAVASASVLVMKRRLKIGRVHLLDRAAGELATRERYWVFGLNDVAGIVHYVMWDR